MSMAMMEVAVVGQMFRMFRERSALGQEPFSWAVVTLGLSGWVLWYTKMTPEHKVPRYSAMIGCGMNFVGFLTVCYFRYWQ